MAKQLNVNLGFSADTSQASVAIQKLAMELQTLGKTTQISNLPITNEIVEAQMAVKELGAILQSSINIETGSFDLSKFNTSLQSSGKNLAYYGNQLGALGPKGDQAFLKIAQAIVKTEVPLRRSSGLLTQFATTLKNTARWQISSSVLHGFMGAVQSAYGYAKKLDESLNNIRIVTEYSAERMSEFAAEANKAAKALSTTTTAYTDASLIYFQQGLNDTQVKERTDITIKMANVTQQSAEVVSDQLTAIWNNFDDGSKSLEYYADVMARLGAETASSTEEIAGGIEKFAGVANTIGLSYEYAASALATITAETRMSEEVVGTALKTIFARIQGLKLGESLEDGTDLNKYSEALKAVGISIFDTNGELKNMDLILDEMGAKWQTLSKDQQTALAQTVAGVRQYTQLVTLMDNWDVMEHNLELSYEATGTLDEQHKIFEESWAASSQRVKASLESIYSSLIDEDFFIDLNNSLSDFLGLIKQVIDAAGGVKGVLAGIGLIVTSVFKEQMATSINNALHNFKIFSGVAVQEMNAVKREAYDMAMSITAGLKDDPNVSALRQSLTTTYDLQLKFNSAVKAMSPEQAQVAKEAMKTAENYSQMAIELADAVVKSEELLANQNKIANTKMGQKAATTITDKTDMAFSQGGSALLGTANSIIADAQGMADINGMTDAIDRASAAVRAYRQAMREGASETEMNDRSQALIASLTEIDNLTTQSAKAFEAYTRELQDAATNIVDISSRFDQFKSGLEGTEALSKAQVEEIRKLAAEAKNAGMPLNKITDALKALNKAGKDPIQVTKAMEQLKSAIQETVISTDMQNNAIAETAKNSSDVAGQINHVNQVMLENADAARNVALSQTNFENGVKRAGVAADEAKNKINNLGLTYKSLGSFITGSLQGLSSFAMGLSSLSSLKDTLNNEDLSTYEKILQVMMSLGMAIPMLTTGLKALANGYKFVTSASAEGLTASVARLAGIKLENVATQVIVKSKTGEILARGKTTDAAVKEAIAKGGVTTVTEIDTAATWANVAAKMVQYWWIGAIIAVLAILAITLVAVANAYNADANAAAAAAEKAEESKKAYEETKQAAEDLKNTISDYSDGIAELEKLKKGTLEYKQALIEANDKAIELIQQYEGLAKYATRNDNGLIVITQEGLDWVLEEQMKLVETSQKNYLRDELKASKAQEKSDLTDFSRKYSISGQDNWKETSEQIVNEIADYLKDNNIEKLIEDDLQYINSFAEATSEVQQHIRDNIDAYSDMGNSLNNTNIAQEALTDAYLDAEWRLRHPEQVNNGDKPINTFDILHGSLFESYFSKNLSDEKQQQYKDNYKKEKKEEFYNEYFSGKRSPLFEQMMLKDYTINSIYQNLTGIAGIDDAEAYAELMGYDEKVGQETSFLRVLGSIFGGSTQDFQFYKNGEKIGDPISDTEIFDLIAEKIASDEAEYEANIKVPELLVSLDSFINSLDDSVALEPLRNLMASGKTVDGKHSFRLSDAGMTQDMAQYLKDNWDDVKTGFEGYAQDEGFWTEMGFESAEEYMNGVKSWIDKRAEMTDYEALGKERVNKMQTVSKTTEEEFLSGDLTTKTAAQSENYIGMTNAANQLAQIYPELIEEAKIFGEEGLIGTERWVAAFNILQDKINDLKLDGLIEEAQDASKKISEFFNEEELNKGEIDIEAVLQSQEFETALDSLLDQNYAIDVEIHAQAEDAFNTFETATNNMVSAASKIGEGYVVAASDIRELNNVFPGIIQNMEDVGDGSVRLNEQIVKDAMNAANAEMGASGESTIAQLENAATLLRSKQKTYLAMYQAALALSKGEGDAATHTQTILDGLNELENLNNKELSDTKMDNAEAVATDSNVQAEITASNWTSAYEAAADSAVKFAQTAVKAAQVAQKGEGTVVKPDFSVNYQGRNGQSSEAAQLADLKETTENAETEDDYAELATAFLNAADAAGAQANDIEGMIAQIGATTVQGNYQLSNTGKEKDDKKDKSKNNKTEKPKTLEKTEHKNKDDEIERYSEITETIDDLTRAYDEAGAAKDDLWGPDKLKAMEAEGKALGSLITAHKKYQKEIAEYDENGNLIGGNLKKDKDAAAAVGATFDENGRINNYDELMGAAVDTWNTNTDSLDTRAQDLENERARIANMEDGAAKDAAQEKYDADMDQLEKDREANDKAFEDTKEALNTYTDTLNLSEEAAAQLQEYIRQMQQIEYEKTMYKVEFKVEVDERALKVIEHKLKRLEDDFFKSAEAMAMIQDKTQYYDKDQFDSINSGVDELKAKFEAGEITQAQYIEGLGQFQDMAMENVDALYEMNDAMKEYYSNTLDAGMQKIKDMTQQFDNLTSRLQHYQNIVNLMGHEQNYELQNKLLQGQKKVLNDQIKVSKETTAMLQGQLAEAEANYAKADEKDKEKWKERILAINKALAEEEEAYLGYVEGIGEIAKEILVNNINAAYDELEKNMTGGLGFENILDEMDMMNTLTDEYLTNTNKMYETNKMIASAQSAIDKTSNLQAKQKYQQYIDYIEQLQTSGELSKAELEVAQARYKVLEAQMALEEAKDAKDTVRLTRDAEGNFGYVYTANQDNVDGAEQNYLDAQNELYNLGLETTNEYREKIINLQKDTVEKLRQLDIDRANGVITTDEELERRRAEILETSQATLLVYQENFGLGQYTMASTQYSTLMAEDENFYKGQLSTQKENQELLGIQDTAYYNGVKTIATETHESLQQSFERFGVNTQTFTKDQYKILGDEDVRYYSTLEDICYGTLDQVYLKYKEGAEKIPGYGKMAADGFDTEIGKIPGYGTAAANGFNTEISKIPGFGEAAALAFQLGISKIPGYGTTAANNFNTEIGKIPGYGQAMADGLNIALNTGEKSAWQYLTDFQTNVEGDEGLGGIKKAFSVWEEDLSPLVDAVGVELDGTESEEGGLSEKIKNTTDASSDLTTELTKDGGLIDSVGDELTAVQKATTAWEDHWKEIQKVTQEYEGLITTIGEYIKKEAEKPVVKEEEETKEEKPKTKETKEEKPKTEETKEEKPKTEETKIPTISKGQKVTVKSTATHFSRDGGNGTKMKSWVPGSTYTVKQIDGNEVLIGVGNSYTGWVKKSDLEGFASGGYTGQWGPEGKLAMLHEKELILNKQDTENFLTATNILREISQMLDNNALVASLGAINLAAMTINSPADQVLQQEVTIHAEFPNVNEHNEIEIAIDNLINAASQHAFKS